MNKEQDIPITDNQELRLSIANDMKKMEIVKKSPFIVKIKVTDVSDNPLKGKRLDPKFQLKGVSNPGFLIKGNVIYKDESDANRKITDETGCIDCRLMIDEISKNIDTSGIILCVSCEGFPMVETIDFIVRSRRKNDKTTATKRKSSRYIILLQKFDALERKYQELNQRVMDIERDKKSS